MIVLTFAVLLSLLPASVLCASSADCQRVNSLFPSTPFFSLSDGRELKFCRFDGDQCCSDTTISIFRRAIGLAVQDDAVDFRRAFQPAALAVNTLRDGTIAVLSDITRDVVGPLLLSAVPAVDNVFTAAVNTTLTDITNALTGGTSVNLTATLSTYFTAVANFYVDSMVDVASSVATYTISDNQRACLTGKVFDQIYSQPAAVNEIVQLLKNISTAIGVVEQLPRLFNSFVAKLDFNLSSSCVNIWSNAFVCPLCAAQPLMCPDRCREVFLGCYSNLHQSIVQAELLFKLTFSILNSIQGAEDRATDSVNVNRIRGLYSSAVGSLQNLDFTDPSLAVQLFTECSIVPDLPIPPLKRRSVHHINKRAITIPNVAINASLFSFLETAVSPNNFDFNSGLTMICDPSFSFMISGLRLQVVAPNGMCSYGVNQVGTYNSNYNLRNVADQVYNNPSGQFDYKELLNRAGNSFYVLTDLFENANTPASLFNEFLPDDMLPTTEFLSAPEPTEPTDPTDPNSGGGGVAELLPNLLAVLGSAVAIRLLY